MIDVAQLLEDSETKTDALEKVAELEEDLSHITERLAEVEEEAMTKTGADKFFFLQLCHMFYKLIHLLPLTTYKTL